MYKNECMKNLSSWQSIKPESDYVWRLRLKIKDWNFTNKNKEVLTPFLIG